MNAFPRTLLAACLLILSLTGKAASNDKLIQMAPDAWMEIPGTRMSDVCFRPAPLDLNCRYIVTAWGGGAYDSRNRKMLVWGGGHGDYVGNEVYAFDTEALKWERLTDPSLGDRAALTGRDPLADGQPASRHTYDGLAFLPHKGVMLAQGGATAGAGNGSGVTWAFNAATRKWENRSSSGSPPAAQECCNFTMDYARSTGKVYLRTTYNLWSYDYDGKTWTRLMDWLLPSKPRASRVDPNRNILFSLGSGDFLAYDIAADKDVTSAWKTTGGDAMISAYGPALEYDAKSGKMVAWDGGSPYVLDLGTRTWTRMSALGAPAQAAEWGTYGRFRYLPEDNVFILVNSAEQNVFFYKLTAGGGSPVGIGILPGRRTLPGRVPILIGPTADRQAVDSRGARLSPGRNLRGSAFGAYLPVPSGPTAGGPP